ncbi:metal ABC transporter solute-binding protein, Zn/Mn family [Deinococcus yavapaiensis]|uniref:Manganese/zinc/iron transport system substrate-binding protein n=1 Tax=Deinococcus yavapaiensis KR-236 TaxID=694435 RepID=A0A318SAQ7_9DEIO|nr:zinc ABC transporter substrate-binding protein [Deinococcus yavapaiensis]PYE53618.1 manganese/zinc/iron transport system substrate-binding protein [Deinococcus yavapaiensis KR-236]
MKRTLLLLPLLTGCAATVAEEDLSQRRMRVTTTVNMLTDVVRQVGGKRVTVTGLMEPGVDPHYYKASAGDVRTLAKADVTFYVGLHLEGKMSEILERMDRFHPTFAVGEAIPTNRLHRVASGVDPHVWFDVSLWKYTVGAVRAGLTKMDPASASYYANNARRYLAELSRLDTWVESELGRIPKARRVLISAHDAFGYFGERYDVEVRGLQGISTVAEAGTHDVRGLAAFIAEREIGAIFVESSVPRRNVEAVRQAVLARGHDVEIGGELFTDSAGAEGTPEGTYVGMIRHNVELLVKALR